MVKKTISVCWSFLCFLVLSISGALNNYGTSSRDIAEKTVSELPLLASIITTWRPDDTVAITGESLHEVVKKTVYELRRTVKIIEDGRLEIKVRLKQIDHYSRVL